ncbi:oligosaccharyltransferase [Suhomyces tanzawaensis NRRL Y-17324]|uniref:Dolichyl-diphosphooligosaccharide--protein glycosyltransferase subunit 1 n=1 Tax=Suhomyces tanzawaensis NRRL Y-17324 TaxID=984487 RepID=A0A1E4SPS1_9ASCO|nr:oligosaccharyltransferase [Suhomyces tanzawaensis NRRL Y-17324]ODV81519.1 oligosaccharyltransferase [Suhomyces tanzawaensis NRRL Y-17324]
MKLSTLSLAWPVVLTSLAVSLNLCHALIAESFSGWENTHYLRTVDLSRSYVKETALIQIKNVDTKPISEYYFTVNDGFDAVAEIAAVTFSVEQGSQKLELAGELVGPKMYKLDLPIPVAPASTAELAINTIYLGSLQPLPAKIGINAVQQLLLQANKYPYSPYTTKEYSMTFTGIRKGQEMELFLSEDIVVSDVPTLKPRVDNKALVYGPISHDIEPFTLVPMGLLYDHNRALGVVENLNRSIWIPASDVEQLPAEEYYELTNKGAQLNTGFSRVDWMKGRYDASNHWALNQLNFPFTPDNSFDDYYYSDLVGAVSTHQTLKNTLVLQPRFPLFGDWHYNFTLSWNYKLSKFVHKAHDSQDTYVAKVPLVNSLVDTTYNNVYLSFYLPENAEFVDVSSPISFESVIVDNELSYLDVSKGHVKVTLHYKNAIDAFNNLDVLIVYKYTKASYIYKVLKISGFVFAGLVSYYLLGLIDLRVSEEEK